MQINPIILLDNGHGKETPGKRSPIWKDSTQLLEYEFNRVITGMIHLRLAGLGINSLLLCPEINDIKLGERVRRANLIYERNKNTFLISVHGNAGGGTGFEIFTSKGQTESDRLATFIIEAASIRLKGWRMRMDYSDSDPDKEANFTIITKTKCPAVLTENLFMDTYLDCKFMMSKRGQEKIIQLHIDGILKFIQYLSGKEWNRVKDSEPYI